MMCKPAALSASAMHHYLGPSDPLLLIRSLFLAQQCPPVHPQNVRDPPGWCCWGDHTHIKPVLTRGDFGRPLTASSAADWFCSGDWRTVKHKLLLLSGAVKTQTCFSPLSPFICALVLGVFGCLWTPHKLCWRWLRCIHYFCQYLCGDLIVLAKSSGQDRAEETPLQSSGFKIRPVSPIALYCLGSLCQLCLISHQPGMLQHTASHKQERERRWTSQQAPGQGKEQQPEHLPVMLILSCAVKEIATNRSKSLCSIVTGCTSGKTQLKEKSDTFQPSQLGL